MGRGGRVRGEGRRKGLPTVSLVTNLPLHYWLDDSADRC